MSLKVIPPAGRGEGQHERDAPARGSRLPLPPPLPPTCRLLASSDLTLPSPSRFLLWTYPFLNVSILWNTKGQS